MPKQFFVIFGVSIRQFLQMASNCRSLDFEVTTQPNGIPIRFWKEETGKFVQLNISKIQKINFNFGSDQFF